MNMCNNCCDSSGYQSTTTCPLACCGQSNREPIYPVSQLYPSANRRTVVQIQKKCLKQPIKLGTLTEPPKKRPDKSPVPSEATRRNFTEKKASISKRSVAPKSLAVSSGEVRQMFDSSSKNTMKSKRVSHSPCLSSEDVREPVAASKPRKSTKKSTVAASDCNDWSDQAEDACDGDFGDARKSKANVSDCDSQHFDGTGDDSRNSSDCDEKPKKSTKSTAKMNAWEKNCSNYMYDNPDLRQTKAKKSCSDSCVELDDANGSDVEVWLFQCPKDFDPKQVMNCELGKAGRSVAKGIECSADRFCTKQTLAVIAPEKAAEYEMFCDNIKLVKPVGKIVVCETTGSKKSTQARDFERSSNKLNTSESENNSEIDDCASSEPEEELRRRQPSPTKRKKNTVDEQRCSDSENTTSKQALAGKKVKKQVKDHRFTIETTLTVEKRPNDRKKTQYLPIDPPEPEPSTTKKKKKSTKGC